MIKKMIMFGLFVSMAALLLVACTSQPAAGNLSPAGSNESTGGETTIPAASPEATQPELKEGEVIVSSFDELQSALTDKAVAVIYITSAIDISGEVGFEREDDLVIHIKPEGSLTITGFFEPVGCSIINDGEITVSGVFQRGIANLTNNGGLTIQSGGKVGSGMSNTENRGTFTIDSEGELTIDRGSVFSNYGTLTSHGLITVKDGGQLNDEGGSIANEGVIDLYAFFNGNIEDISGSGTVNDHRE